LPESAAPASHAASSLFLAVIPLFHFAVIRSFMLAARQDFCGERDIDG
jgi:hypothetical protein